MCEEDEVNISGTLSASLLLSSVFSAVRQRVGLWGARGLLEQPLVFLIYARLGLVSAQIERLAARFAAGRLWTRRPRAMRAEIAEDIVAGPAVIRGPRVWPYPLEWLVRMVGWEAGGYGGQVRHLLEQPDMVALLRASPQAALILGPVCRMLGIPSRVLRPLPEGVVPPVPVAAPLVLKEKKKRTRPAPIDWGRIPLPRGVLTAARRAGFKPVR